MCSPLQISIYYLFESEFHCIVCLQREISDRRKKQSLYIENDHKFCSCTQKNLVSMVIPWLCNVCLFDSQMHV